MDEHAPQDADEPDTAPAQDEGPDVEELEDDPAYNPQDENLKHLKGG